MHSGRTATNNKIRSLTGYWEEEWWQRPVFGTSYLGKAVWIGVHPTAHAEHDSSQLEDRFLSQALLLLAKDTSLQGLCFMGQGLASHQATPNPISQKRLFYSAILTFTSISDNDKETQYCSKQFAAYKPNPQDQSPVAKGNSWQVSRKSSRRVVTGISMNHPTGRSDQSPGNHRVSTGEQPSAEMPAASIKPESSA